MGVFVMCEVEIAEPFEGQDQDEPADPPHDFVQPRTGKGGLVRRLMFKREEEDQQYPLQRQREPP